MINVGHVDFMEFLTDPSCLCMWWQTVTLNILFCIILYTIGWALILLFCLALLAADCN